MEIPAKILLFPSGKTEVYIEMKKGTDTWIEVSAQELTEMAKKVSQKKKKAIKISDEEEIDFDKEYRESVLGKAKKTAQKAKLKAFLSKVVAKKRVKMSEAKQAKEEQLKEAQKPQKQYFEEKAVRTRIRENLIKAGLFRHNEVLSYDTEEFLRRLKSTGEPYFYVSYVEATKSAPSVKTYEQIESYLKFAKTEYVSSYMKISIYEITLYKGEEAKEQKAKTEAYKARVAGKSEAPKADTYESLKAQFDAKRDSMVKAGEYHYKELSELKEIAKKAPLPEITKENAIDPFFKNLKVGDKLSSQRYGESQESASVLVGASWKVVEISSGHQKFKLHGGEWTHTDANGTIQIDVEGSYMSIKRTKNSDVIKARAENQYFIPTFESMIAGRVATEYASAEMRKADVNREAKKEEDWTKKNKYELVSMIDAFFEKQGKEMRGHKTASKPRLIEIIRKYKIRE